MRVIMGGRPAGASTSTPEEGTRTLHGRRYRRIGEADRPAVEALLRSAVPDDYLLPMVGDWIERGMVLGGWQGDRLVAILRLDDLGDGEGWVGGIRVAPELRRQGVARDLMEFAFGVSRHHGLGTLRLLIEAENEASQHLARSLGFERTQEIVHLAGPLVAPAERPRVVPLRSAPEADPEGFSWVRSFHGLFSPTVPELFRLVRASRSRMERESREGTLYAPDRPGTAFALSPPRPVTWSDRTVRAFSPLEGPLELLLQGAAELTREDGSLVDCFLPASEDALSTATRQGLVRGALWGASIGLYELVLGG